MGEYLCDQGYSVLGVRLSAHATRPEDMVRSRWADWVASVEDGWHLLSGCSDQIFPIGLSMGGLLSLHCAANYPVAGVVAMATPHHMPEDPRVKFLKLLSVLRPMNPKGPPQWADKDAYNRHVSYPVDPTRAYVEVRELMKEVHSALPRVTAPALLINSKDDPTVRAEDQHQENIFAGIGSQDKLTLWIEGSGHVITCDAKRQTVFQAIADFIKRVSAGKEL